MGMFMRKSLKMGPVRFNLSKSGIGVSAGIKGLRVGVSGNGKSYVSGGRNGVYFKQNLGSSNRSGATISGTSKPAMDHSIDSTDKFEHSLTLNNIELGNFSLNKSNLYRITFWSGVGLFILAPIINQPIILLLSILVLVINFPTKFIRKSKAKKLISNIGKLLKDRKIDDLNNSLDAISTKYRKDQSFKAYVLSNTYANIIPDIVEDMKIDSDEEKIIKLLKDHLPQDTWLTINSFYLNNLLSNFIDDKYLDQSEEEFLVECLSIFDIPQADQEKYSHLIDQYSAIRKLSESPLQNIKPSLANIKESDKCFYESSVRILKSKIVKSFTQNGVKNKIRQLLLDREGSLFITENTLQLVTTGHMTIKLENILENNYLEEEEGIIELTILNKTQPIYLSTPNIIETFTLLNKVLGNKLS